MLGSSAMYSMCTSGCGTRAAFVWAGVCGFEKEAGLVISETTCGGRPSAGNRIASKHCIKSMGWVLGNKRLSVSDDDPVGIKKNLIRRTITSKEKADFFPFFLDSSRERKGLSFLSGVGRKRRRGRRPLVETW